MLCTLQALKALDECHTLSEVLREEVSKAQRNMLSGAG
jgi:hypothetical protein